MSYLSLAVLSLFSVSGIGLLAYFTNMRKRIIASVLALILGITVPVSVAYYINNKSDVISVASLNVSDYTEIKLTAHRGFSALAPENTLEAFRLAGEAKFYAVECDVYLTKDGVWVIQHDDTVDRMTNGTGKIIDYTYAELRQFNIDNGNGLDKAPGQKIPTLEEYLQVCSKYDIAPEIEIKEGSNEKLAEILTLLDKYGLKEKGIIISFNADKLDVLRKIDGDIEMWYLTNEITDEVINHSKEKNYAVAFNCSKNNNSVIKSAAKTGVKLCAWTVDTKKEAERLYKCGVRYITSNCIMPNVK